MYSQKISSASPAGSAIVDIRMGSQSVSSVTLSSALATSASATVAGKGVGVVISRSGANVILKFTPSLTLTAPDVLTIVLS